MTTPGLSRHAPGAAEARWPARPSRVLNMSTGPVEVSQRVLNAQLAGLLTPHSPNFWALHDETTQLIARALRTRARVLMMHGSIRTGLDLALGNLIEPGTRVLSIQNGFWGTLIADWAARRGALVTRVDHGPLEQVSVDRVSEALAKASYDLVTLVHVETSSGIVNPVAAIGDLVAGTRSIYLVDTACSAGAMQVDTDAWSIDVQVTGSHKCLAAVPGLTIVTLSEKAWRGLKHQASMGSYFEFGHWWHNVTERSDTPPFTQPTTLVLALREALLETTAAGVEAWWQTHRQAADAFMYAMRSTGFTFLLDGDRGPVNRALYSDTVMAVRYPQGVLDAGFREILLKEFGLFVIGNVGALAGSSFRVGLMSPPQLDRLNMYGAIAAFRHAVDRQGASMLSGPQ